MFTKPPGNKALALSITVAIAASAVILCSAAAQASGQKTKPIISTLQSEGDFSTFLKAINSAGLAKTLHGQGPYTVFAPNNAAFAKLPADQRNDLLSDKAKLKRLIDFHVIHTKLTSAQLSAQKAGSTPNTLEGDPLRVASAAGVVTVNGAAFVKPDVAATNGTIQEIDTVLMPPTTIVAMPGPKPPAPPARPPAPANPPAQVNPPASPPAPAVPPSVPPSANPSGAPGTTMPEQPVQNQPVPTPANPPGAPGTPAPAAPGDQPGSLPPANNPPAQ